MIILFVVEKYTPKKGETELVDKLGEELVNQIAKQLVEKPATQRQSVYAWMRVNILPRHTFCNPSLSANLENPRCIPMQFSASRSLRQPLLDST